MFDPGGHNVRSARFSRASPNSLRPPTGRVSPRAGSTRRSRVTQLSPTVTPIDASDLRPPSAACRCVPRVVPRQTVGNVHDIAHVNAHRRGCKFQGGGGGPWPAVPVGRPSAAGAGIPPRITGAGPPRGRKALAPSPVLTLSGLVGACASCPNAHIAD